VRGISAQPGIGLEGGGVSDPLRLGRKFIYLFIYFFIYVHFLGRIGVGDLLQKQRPFFIEAI